MSLLYNIKEFLKLQRDLRIIRKSQLFDEQWYLKKYRDVAKSGMDAAEHYLRFGGFEGRNPSPGFNSDEYLAINADVRKSRMNPLVHYERHGRKERRAETLDEFADTNRFEEFKGYLNRQRDIRTIHRSSLFDDKWYLSKYPDVAKVGMDAAEHYLLFGGFEGRNPSPRFNSSEYLAMYADVREFKMNPLLHYERLGKKEGRPISYGPYSHNLSRFSSAKEYVNYRKDLQTIKKSKLFDERWYLKKYRDVAQIGMNAAEHYLIYGGFEGRNPSTRFYSDEYLAMYADVREKNINPLLHYERFGKAEGRPISRGRFRISQMPWPKIRKEMVDRCNANIIRRSSFFDGEWYLKNNLSAYVSGANPARHYLKYAVSNNRNPSPYFTGEEYRALHYDVRMSGINPLLHYELHGKREGRPISFLELKEPVFPEGTQCGEWRFGKKPCKHRRTAVVASYFGDGTPSAGLLFLLNGLREVVDNIVLVADCQVNPEEVEKLRDLVTVAKFERHGRYDFGSYRIGLEVARAEGLLDPDSVDEFVLINDSCYGPVYPFAESFEEMASRSCDFWGYTGYDAFGNIHISSYFFLFRRNVIDSGKIEEFLSRVQGRFERGEIVVLFEFRFTKFLEDAGFSWDTFVPMKFGSRAPTKYPFTLCSTHRMPLLKAKTVNGDSFENLDKVMGFVHEVNPQLAELIQPRPLEMEHKIITMEEHQASFPSKCARIAKKMEDGEKVKTVFFVSEASMFPARPLFDVMLSDAAFDPYVVVIPDVRWIDMGGSEEMEKCRQALAQTVPEERISVAELDEFGVWKDVLEGVDIVCYPSPYDLSSFRYNQRYAAGRDFLPICVNYGFYRSKYDRHITQRESYSYMWKAFFECEDSVEEYREYSETKGSNVDLSGYIKMDPLAKAQRECESRSGRTRILVAPHHSVEGGTNQALALANFVRYADFFMDLPDRYPELDFIFRPHPFLFKVMARPNQWGEEKTAEYIAALKAKPNVIWSDGGDYFREFAESDACIQDCGSYLVEYFYTKKPCCYMLKSPDDIEEKFAPLGKKCLENCYIAYDTDAIDNFIRDVVIGGDDPKKESREAFADTVMVNYPHAADTALAHIKQGILDGAATISTIIPEVGDEP